jgi:hypothetical protein
VVGKRREVGWEIAGAGRAATSALRVMRRCVDFIAKVWCCDVYCGGLRNRKKRENVRAYIPASLWCFTTLGVKFVP